METTPSPSHLKITVNKIRLNADIIRGGDALLVLGVLHRVKKKREGISNKAHGAMILLAKSFLS